MMKKGFVGVIVACCMVLLFACSGTDIPNYSRFVTPGNIVRIRLGMSKKEVVAILGKAVTESRETFTYTAETKKNHPMLWVHFDENEAVWEVYAKYYEGWDDRGIYGLSRTREGEVFEWGREALDEYFPVRVEQGK